MKKLLLLSNSTNPGEQYFGWPEQYVRDFLGGKAHKILFIPYAAVTLEYDAYEKMVAERFGPMGYQATGIHRHDDPVAAVRDAEVIVVGGGNTFHLLHKLQRAGLLGIIRKKVDEGASYIGWSAGSNIACPTIQTTNDMPVVLPENFDALDLVPFQINPHYTEATIPNHGGETREMRIREYLQINQQMTVLGLPEGSLLQVEGKHLAFMGKGPLKIFRQGQEAEEAEDGADLDELLRQ